MIGLLERVGVLFDDANGDESYLRECILQGIARKKRLLKFAPPALKADREVVMEAVKQTGWALQYATPALKADQEVVMEAVKQDWRALDFASDNLKAEKEFMLAAVKQNGGALYNASPALKNKIEVVMEAVKQNGKALQFASAILKADREIVLEAVKQNGGALEYASSALRVDGLKNFIKEQLTIFNQFNTFLLGQFKSSNTKTLDPPSGTNYLCLLGRLDTDTKKDINQSIAKCLGWQDYKLSSLKGAAENLSISI